MMLIGQALYRFPDVRAQKQRPQIVTEEISRVLYISSVNYSDGSLNLNGKLIKLLIFQEIWCKVWLSKKLVVKAPTRTVRLQQNSYLQAEICIAMTCLLQRKSCSDIPSYYRKSPHTNKLIKLFWKFLIFQNNHHRYCLTALNFHPTAVSLLLSATIIQFQSSASSL